MNKDKAQKIIDANQDIYNQIAEKYASVRNEPWEELDFLFGKFLRSGDKVLDLGCGNGRFYDSFMKNGVFYTGIDNSENLLKIAQKNHSEAEFILASALNLPFNDEEFDAVYGIAILHHIPSDKMRQIFMEEAIRVTKKDGYLVLTVWDLQEKQEEGKKKFNIFDLFNQRIDKNDVFIPWYGAKDCYFHSFTMETFKRLVEDSGLIIIERGEILVGRKPYRNLYIVAKKK
ncbi:MAG: methyltransferase domain-containing protein [Candidatus Paceibacterota bacterium]